MRFKGHARLTFESRFTGEADKLCAKLLISTGQLSFQDMLTEICSLIALFSKGHAETILNSGIRSSTNEPIPRVANVVAERRAV